MVDVKVGDADGATTFAPLGRRAAANKTLVGFVTPWKAGPSSDLQSLPVRKPWLPKRFFLGLSAT